MNREAVEEHEEGRIRRLIDDRGEKVVLALFEEADDRTKRNDYTHIISVILKTTVKAFFNGGAVELLQDKLYSLAEFQDSTQDIVRHLIKSLTFSMPVTHFVKQQAERAAAYKANFRQDMILETPIIEEVTPPTPFIGCIPESSKTSKDYKREKR